MVCAVVLHWTHSKLHHTHLLKIMLFISFADKIHALHTFESIVLTWDWLFPDTMRRRWFKKRILCVCLLSVFLYLVFRIQKQNGVFEAVIENSKSVDVWEFVADFSNHRKINPNLIDFNIKSEGGNYDHWHYSAEYTEFLLYLPFIHNFADAHFNVKPGDGGVYIIQSTHNTCFFTRFLCLSSEAEFRFEPVGRNTRCVKKITYECPLACTLLCYNEVMYQQKTFMSNLQKHFIPPVIVSKNTRHT